MNRNWKVIYYTSESHDNPVQLFLDNLESREQSKILRILQYIREYGLISVLPQTGTAILNADDERIIILKELVKCDVITYGIKNLKADYLAKDIIKVIDGQYGCFQRSVYHGFNGR